MHSKRLKSLSVFLLIFGILFSLAPAAYATKAPDIVIRASGQTTPVTGVVVSKDGIYIRALRFIFCGARCIRDV